MSHIYSGQKRGTAVRRESTREEKGLKSSSRDKKAKARTVVGREKSLICDPGSELRQGGREKKGEKEGRR